MARLSAIAMRLEADRICSSASHKRVVSRCFNSDFTKSGAKVQLFFHIRK